MSAATSHAERLLAEAAAETTPGERLRAILAIPGGHPWPPEWRPIESAALGNPSLPLDLLSGALRRGRIEAWQNPGVPLALLAQPDARHRHGAMRALMSFESQFPQVNGPPPMTLDDGALAWRVGWWAATRQPDAAPVVTFARHLASLLALPWPDP